MSTVTTVVAPRFPRCAQAVEVIGCFWSVVTAFINGLAKMHDDGNWGRKSVSYFTLALTARCSFWAFEYAIARSALPGADTALVIAAVMAPVGLLQAAIAKFYFEANTRTEQIAAGVPPTTTGTTVNTTVSA